MSIPSYHSNATRKYDKNYEKNYDRIFKKNNETKTYKLPVKKTNKK